MPIYRLSHTYTSIICILLSDLAYIDTCTYSFKHFFFPSCCIKMSFVVSIYYTTFFFHLLLLVGGWLLYNIVMIFVIHWQESAMGLHVFPIPIPPPTSLSTRSLWVFPVHQVWALVLCIQPGLVICFTLDNIHVSMLFSRNWISILYHLGFLVLIYFWLCWVLQACL